MDTSIYSEKIISRKEAKSQGLLYYFTGAPCKHGHISKKKVSTYSCYQCERIAVRKFHKKYWKENHEEGLERARRSQQNLRRSNPICLLISAAKRRAKLKNIEFLITPNDITIPTHCPVFGIPLFINNGRQTDNSPSLDRIDNTKGYIPGNVQIISWRANRRKSDMSIDEITALSIYVNKRKSP